MVNFGKKLMADQLEEWQEYYINYKMMKKKVKQYVQQNQTGGKNRDQVLKEFSRMLDDQIEKIVLFLLQQQGYLARRIENLGEQRAALMGQCNALHFHYQGLQVEAAAAATDCPTRPPVVPCSAAEVPRQGKKTHVCVPTMYAEW